MSRKLAVRWTYYILGMLILAMGLTLNTNSNFGTSPIVSVPYTISFLCDISFANLTLITYAVMIGLQFILKGKQRKLIDVLQIVLSIAFTRVLDVFIGLFDFSASPIWVRVIVLAIGIILTGIGAALTVAMNLIPNPGDGFVQSVGMCIHKSLGTSKNIVDVTCVCISLILGFIAQGTLLGVGAGTFAAMIFVGRTIAVFNYFVKDKIIKQAFTLPLA